MSKSFNKISIKPNKVEIGYISHINLEEGDIVKNVKNSISSDIRPHKDFYSAFSAMKKYAIGYMEITAFKTGIEQSVLDRYVMNSMSIIEDTDTVKITMSITKTLSNGKEFKIKTPIIDLLNDDYTDLKEMRHEFDILLNEASDYVDGKNGDTQLIIDFKAA